MKIATSFLNPLVLITQSSLARTGDDSAYAASHASIRAPAPARFIKSFIHVNHHPSYSSILFMLHVFLFYFMQIQVTKSAFTDWWIDWSIDDWLID